MPRVAHKTSRRNLRKRPVVLTFILLGIAYVTFVLAMKVFLPTYRIPTGSMSPTVHVGDLIVASRFAYRWPPGAARQKPKRWDMVVYRAGEASYVQRIAAMPGEIVAIRNKQLFVDGVAISDRFASHSDATIYPNLPNLPEPYRSRDWFGPLKISPGQYFVLGDNRDSSHDSRYRGPVAETDILGKVIYVCHAE